MRGIQRALPCQDGNFLAMIKDVGSAVQINFIGQASAPRPYMGGVVRHISLGGMFAVGFHVLHVHGKSDVSHFSIGERGAASQVHHVLQVRGSHDARVVRSHVHEKAVEGDILLGKGVIQIVKGKSGNRQHRLAVELGIIEPVQEMDAARAGGSQTYSQLSRVLGVGAGH